MRNSHVKKILTVITSIAVIYFLTTSTEVTQNLKLQLNEDRKCCRYPTPSDIKYDHPTWQIFEMPNGTLKLFNAYLDERPAITVVRVNTFGGPLHDKTDIIYCQLWYKNSKLPHIVQATEYLLMWYYYVEKLSPYLISCPIYNDHVPDSISLVQNPSDNATNNLKVLDPKPKDGKKEKFGMCSKYVYFEDRNYLSRLVEWIHLQQLVGVRKMHFFNKLVHPDISTMFKYFEDKDILEVTQYLPPTGMENLRTWETQHWLLEMVILNDCFYRTRHFYETIGIYDPDEMILPTKDSEKTWEQMMERYIGETYDGYNALNIFFPPETEQCENIPKHMYMLQHTQRVAKFNDDVKSLHVTKQVTVVHNHRPLRCLRDRNACKVLEVSEEIIRNVHYRNSVLKTQFGEAIVNDTSIWKYKDDLIKLVDKTFKDLKMKP